MTVKDLKELLRMAPDSAELSIGNAMATVEFTGITVQSPMFSADTIHASLTLTPGFCICSEKFQNDFFSRYSCLLLREQQMSEELLELKQELQSLRAQNAQKE